MRIWLVNPFDPLPGDPEQEGRYATLARMLIARGHGLTWWTSSFSHRFKRPVDQPAVVAACRRIGVDLRFLTVPAYRRNVGLARVRNHVLLARVFEAQARQEPDSADLVLASVPPPELAAAAGAFAHSAGAPFVIDVQDLWPETFRRLAPRPVRPLLDLVLRSCRRTARKAYRLADAVVGVADAYVERAVSLGGQKRRTAMIPLGVDLGAFEAAATRGRSDRFTKPPGHVWLIYSGSLNRSYDCLTILRAFARARAGFKTPVRLFVTGRGELSARAERLVRRQALHDVTLTGFLDFDQWAYLLGQCDAGFNASFPDAMIFLPNKIFYYLAAGLAVLNTIPGQCSRIVRAGRCGLDYRAGDVRDCTAAIERIVAGAEERTAMGRAARRLAETTYDRRRLYLPYVELIEQLGAGG